MIEIDDVAARVVPVSVDIPGLGAQRTIQLVVVQARTTTGQVGHAISSGPEQHFASEALVNKEISPLLRGNRYSGPTEIQMTLRAALNSRFQSGAYSQAVSAVDIAVWDCVGQALDTPVYALLGGARDAVPYYITFGVGEFDTKQLAQAAVDTVAEGHRGLKMIVGGYRVIGPTRGATSPLKRSIAEESERVHAVRDAVGPDVDIMIDGNLLFDLKSAWDLTDRLRDVGLAWFEEPVVGNDPHLLALLRASSPVRIAAGGNIGDLAQFQALLAQEAVDLPQPNVIHIGGYTGGRKVAAMAEARCLTIDNGQHWPHLNAHLHAAVPNGGAVEMHWFGWKATEQLFDCGHRLDVEAGVLRLPDRPGLGMSLRDPSLFD